MSSKYFVKVPDSTSGPERTMIYEVYELDLALSAFFGAIKDGAEAAELRWSA